MPAPSSPAPPTGPTSGLVEPIPAAILARLRQAVQEHARSEHRRVFPASVHVGVPGLVRTALVLDAEVSTDHGLRVDVLEAMVRRVRRPGPRPMVWLTRAGALDVQDVDVAWLAAALAAGGELGIALPMVVVNRRSWRDPRTGVGRTWQRLR